MINSSCEEIRTKACLNILFQVFYASMICSFLVEEEKNCIDPTGRLLFRKPKEKSADTDTPPVKSDIVEMASNKSTKRKPPITTQKDNDHGNTDESKKKTKTQLLSFMDESGFDGDD